MSALGAEIPSVQSTPPRVARACERCRSRKVRCDGNAPCSGCGPGRHPCIYQPRTRTRQKRQRTHSIVDSPGPSSQTPLPQQSGPRLHDPAQFKRQRELRVGIGVSNVDSGSFQFYGPSSHFCFIQRMCQRITRTTNESFLTPRTSVPGGVAKWNLERFMFSLDANRSTGCQPDAYIMPDIGTSLIESYFEIIHPQIPLLYHADILELWHDMGKPPGQQGALKGKETLFMVLAIGARVAIADGKQDASVLEDWATYFAGKANVLQSTFEDITLSSTIFLVLKAMYAYQVMRPNEAYLYLGHAARSAMALGINRQQVVSGANVAVHGMKRAFWTLYSHERMCSLYTGRPSAFRDDLNDAPYPEDLPLPAMADSTVGTKSSEPMRLCGFIRAISDIGNAADRVFVEIYSPKSIATASHLIRIRDVTTGIEPLLESATRQLPLDLHFFDTTLPVGHGWQEVQRLTLGCYYYFVRMLMHRPALLYAAFFDSREEAQKSAGDTFNIHFSILETIQAAINVIDLTHDVYFRRYPRARVESTSATLLVSACVTLLYDVLDPKTSVDHAKNVFAAVERGVACIDQIHHVGHTTGKAVSLDVMKIAKNALNSTAVDSELSENLFGAFPWLQNLSPPDGALSNAPSTTPNLAVPQDNLFTMPGDASGVTSYNYSPDVNYISHWLEAGFAPEEIPSSLFNG